MAVVNIRIVFIQGCQLEFRLSPFYLEEIICAHLFRFFSCAFLSYFKITEVESKFVCKELRVAVLTVTSTESMQLLFGMRLQYNTI